MRKIDKYKNILLANKKLEESYRKNKNLITEEYETEKSDLINRIIQMDRELENDPLYKQYEDVYADQKITKMLQMKMGMTEIPKEMLDTFKEIGKAMAGGDKNGVPLTPERVVSQKDSVINTTQEILDLAIQNEEYGLASKLRDFLKLLNQL
jgi:protein-arginine kinase activator protein McsA